MSGGARRCADETLIAALAGGSTVVAAAQAAGVSEATVRRRQQDAGFRARLAEARSTVVEQATARLTAASTTAVATLVQLCDGADAESVRLAAAKAILELGARWREQGELEQRLTALEVAALPDAPAGLRRVL